MPRQMLTDELWTKLQMIVLKMGVYDRGYDSEELRTQIRDQEVIPVIPRRHVVENVFARFKQFRGIAQDMTN